MSEPVGMIWDSVDDYDPGVFAAVTKLLDRGETRANPDAVRAVQKEGEALVKAGTWLEDTVVEKTELIERAKRDKDTIHLGELMPICSIKFWEMPPEQHKYKGRICFRGDNVRDEQGAAAVFQEISANPTSVHDANSNMAYGRLPGNKTTQADAVRAYIQSLLRSKHKTWVAVPKELWPASWHKQGFKKPMCLLERAIYGHPESGGHWEAHLTETVVHLGGVPVEGHPSSFWFEKERLLLTVYVDDLLLSGPEEHHARFWQRLRSGPKAVHIEEPEPLDRFLGRGHEEVNTPTGSGLAFSMEEYTEDALKMYMRFTGTTSFKPTTTPFCPEGALLDEDDCIRGELEGHACAILMKDLWLARLARPDIQKPICDLTTHIQCWSRNDDKKLHRLMAYLHSSKGFRLVGRVNDPAELLSLRLYVDADFSGEREDARSTSGGFLVLYGPHTWFPLAWVSKRQTATSRSTTEAEVISLAASLFSEALPAMSLWDRLLGRPVSLQVMEDNQATIKVVRKGYSAKLRHVSRTHKVNLSSIHEAITRDRVSVDYCKTDEQSADIFTKALPPNKWENALTLLGIMTTTSRIVAKR